MVLDGQTQRQRQNYIPKTLSGIKNLVFLLIIYFFYYRSRVDSRHPGSSVFTEVICMQSLRERIQDQVEPNDS